MPANDLTVRVSANYVSVAAIVSRKLAVALGARSSDLLTRPVLGADHRRWDHVGVDRDLGAGKFDAPPAQAPEEIKNRDAVKAGRRQHLS